MKGSGDKFAEASVYELMKMQEEVLYLWQICAVAFVLSTGLRWQSGNIFPRTPRTSCCPFQRPYSDSRKDGCHCFQQAQGAYRAVPIPEECTQPSLVAPNDYFLQGKEDDEGHCSGIHSCTSQFIMIQGDSYYVTR